jgi:hypothetical protein
VDVLFLMRLCRFTGGNGGIKGKITFLQSDFGKILHSHTSVFFVIIAQTKKGAKGRCR